MKLTDEVWLSPDVVTRAIGEETMLLDLASGTYYGLDAVGAQFVSLVQQGKSALEARDALLEIYDVETEVIDRDLEALLDSLSLRGIVRANH